jgi:predicted transcriptional regulator
MSEKLAKQKRRRRAQLIQDVLSLTPDAYEEAQTTKLVAAVLKLSDAQFAQLSFRLAKQLAQTPMRNMVPIRGGQ